MNNASYHNTQADITSSATASDRDTYLLKLMNDPALSGDSIAYFRAVTNVENPDIIALMGSLADTHSPQEFSAFCSAFADGLAYVHERFGTQPANIMFTDDPTTVPAHDASSHMCLLPRAYIAQGLDNALTTQSKTAPFILDSLQMATMYGVEEGVHHFQAVRDPIGTNMMLERQMIASGEPDYDRQPLEAEAKLIVHEAMVDFGYAQTAPLKTVNIGPDEAGWAKNILRERNVINTAPDDVSWQK